MSAEYVNRKIRNLTTQMAPLPPHHESLSTKYRNSEEKPMTVLPTTFSTAISNDIENIPPLTYSTSSLPSSLYSSKALAAPGSLLSDEDIYHRSKNRYNSSDKNATVHFSQYPEVTSHLNKQQQIYQQSHLRSQSLNIPQTKPPPTISGFNNNNGIPYPRQKVPDNNYLATATEEYLSGSNKNNMNGSGGMLYYSHLFPAEDPPTYEKTSLASSRPTLSQQQSQQPQYPTSSKIEEKKPVPVMRSKELQMWFSQPYV